MTQHAAGIKERPEEIEDLLNRARQLSERWDDRLTLDNLALAERYSHGELQVVLVLRATAVDTEDLYAIFQIERTAGDECNASGPRNLVEGLINRQYGRSHREEQAVLVGDAETVQPPERFVASVVWTGGLDEINGGLTRSLYLSAKEGFKSLGCARNGKAGFLRRYHGVGDDQLPGQVIQRGSQIVHSVANDDLPPERRIVGSVEAHDDLVGFAIHLASHELLVTRDVRAHELLELVDVLVGPFDFRPWPIERVD